MILLEFNSGFTKKYAKYFIYYGSLGHQSCSGNCVTPSLPGMAQSHALSSCVAANGIYSGVMSREMETAEPFTFDVPQHHNASSEQFMGSNDGSTLAGQSEALHVHQKGSGEFSGLYAQPFTCGLPQHQEASTGQPMGSNFWPMSAGQSEVQHAHQKASGQFSGINAPLFTSYPPQQQEATHQDQGVMSRETDGKKFSFRSLLLDDDVEMETVELLTLDLPKHENASSEQFMDSNYGSIVAGPSEEALHVHQKGSGEFSGLYAQPFTADPPRHQEASTGQPMGSNFWPMPAGKSKAQTIHQQASGRISGVNAQMLTSDQPQHHEASMGQLIGSKFGHMVSEAQHAHQEASGQLSGINAPLFTSYPHQHQEATLRQLFGSDFGPMVAGQSQALHVHQQSPGLFSGVNDALIFSGNSESMQDYTQNTSLYQHHQAAVVAEKSPFQAWPSKQNYGCSATSKADFILELYPYTTYGSTTSPFLGQNPEHANQQNEIHHPQHVTVHGSQMIDHSHGIGTDGLQVALIPWQYRELSEQQHNVSATEDFGILNSQVLSSTGHAKDKGKALATKELSAGGKTKAAGAIVEEANQSQLNKKYCPLHSSEQLCRDSRFSCQPASFQLKMSENCQMKCKNVISKIEKRIKEDGDNIVPLIADIWNMDDKSARKMNFAGLRTVDFRNISQRLKENVFETLYDFIKEVQSMLKGVADEFRISCEVVEEVNTIHNLFFEYLESTFESINFSRERKEVEFSSTLKVRLLSPNWRKRKE